MAKWYEETVATLDFETTGLDPLNDRVVQVAFLIQNGKSKLENGGFSRIVNPGIPVPREASDIHGLTTAIVKKEGHDPAQVFAELAAGVDSLTDREIPLVIFNAPFDWPFLLAEAARHGIDAPRMPRIIDPLTIDKAIDKYRRGRRNLESMAAHYNVRIEKAHDAVEDSLVSVGIARQIGSVNSEIGNSALDELHEKQEKWYDAQSLSFAKYLRSQGKDASDVYTGWPIHKHLRKKLS